MEDNNIFKSNNLEVINLGIMGFYDSVKSQNVSCVHVEWQPPAGGNTRLIEIIDRLKEIG